MALVKKNEAKKVAEPTAEEVAAAATETVVEEVVETTAATETVVEEVVETTAAATETVVEEVVETTAAAETETAVEDEEDFDIDEVVGAADTEVEEVTEETVKPNAVAVTNAVVEGDLPGTNVVVQPETTSLPTKTDAQSQAFANAEAQGFGGLEGGFGSYNIIKLESSGKFSGLDDEDLGSRFRAILKTSKPSYLYTQEGEEDGEVAYSYDGVTIDSYSGDEQGIDTVAKLKALWEELGYDMEEKKYLEVLAIIANDQEDIFDDATEDLTDMEGEPVILRIPPSGIRAFSGKAAQLEWEGVKLDGAMMDFYVGKQRTNGRNKYYPWKFKIVKK